MAVGQDGCRVPASWMGERKGVGGWGHLYPGLDETGGRFGNQVVNTGMARVTKRKGRTRIKLETNTFSFNTPFFFDY